MDVRLDDRTAIVTGASRGIGLAVARQLVESGAKVVVSSRKQEALEEALAAWPAELRGRAAAVAAHVGDPEAVEGLVARSMEQLGRIDILVNNAATNPYMGPTIEIDLPRYDKTWEVNLRGQLVCAQNVWRASMKERGGAIVNVASIGGLTVEPLIGVYNATKAALTHLTRTLAAELAPGVRVNAVAPGLVKTHMARALWEPNEESMARTVPMRRLGEPEDIATAVTFLVSDAASWITGETLVVDGGMMLAPRL